MKPSFSFDDALWQEIRDRVESMRLACTGEREMCDVQDDTEALAKLALECEGTLKLIDSCAPSPPSAQAEVETVGGEGAPPGAKAETETGEPIELNLSQVRQLEAFFGGEDTDAAVQWLPEWKNAEGDMPAGVYVYCTEYPEEGRIWLNPDEPLVPPAGRQSVEEPEPCWCFDDIHGNADGFTWREPDKNFTCRRGFKSRSDCQSEKQKLKQWLADRASRGGA